MFRRNWRNREFWAWWWGSTLSPRLRSAAAVGGFIFLGAAGVFSADRLSSAKASPDNVTVWESTVERTVTRAIAGHDHVVTVQVVRHVRGPRVVTRARTAAVTPRTVGARPQVVTRRVIDEHTVTRSKTHLVIRTVTHNVTQTTPPVTVTTPPVTVTQTLPAQTATQTVTVTVPPGHGH